MELLLSLFLAHLAGDFYLQKNEWVTNRNRLNFRSPGLLKHSISHAVLTLIVVLLYRNDFSEAIFSGVIIGVSHFFIDAWKSYNAKGLRYFIIDQLLHLLMLVFVWALLLGAKWIDVRAIAAYVWNINTMAVVLAFALMAKPTSILISSALSRYATAMLNFRSGANRANNEETVTGLVSAGEMIGVLERWLIVSFILVNQFAGIGFLLAAKTIFRFGDLTHSNDQKMTEYVLLGTLVSFFTALSVGWLAVKLITA